MRMKSYNRTGDNPLRQVYIGDIFPDFENPWIGYVPPPDRFLNNVKCSGNLVNSDYHVVDNEKVFSIEFKVPGLNKNDIEITLENNILTVEYKKVEEENNINKYYFATKSFKKIFTIPDECNLDTIMSKYEDGILKVSVDKIVKVIEPPEIKRIEVQ